MRSRAFQIGFLAGLLLMSVVNVVDYYQMGSQRVAIDGNTQFGFPFDLYVTTGFGDAILWPGLVADVLIAVCGSIILGLAVERAVKRPGRLP